MDDAGQDVEEQETEQGPARDRKRLSRRAVARIMVRRNVSERAVRELEAFLRRTAVGRYSMGEAGSQRSGYWTTVEVTDRRDLDRVRQSFRRLIDGWQELP